MKHFIRNCFATTGLSLLLLAVVATLYEANFLFINSIHQVAIANLAIHLGLSLLKRFESSYCALEIALELGYIFAVVILFGYFFGWYSSTPIWVLIIMGIAVYIAGGLIDIFRIHYDVNMINKQLQLRKQTDNPQGAAK